MERAAEEVLTRLEAAARRLEEAACALDEGRSATSGNLERISATVEPGEREAELSAKLAELEREIAELKASSAGGLLNPLRKTLPAPTMEMLAKHGIGEGQVDVRRLDAALVGLSLEQRIAVKSQLLRAGAIA